MILTQVQLDQLIAQARGDAPYETCGMIGGKDGRALKIYPIRNAAENRVIHYRMDGGEQYRALADIEDNGMDLVAIYHSHPATRAYPSPTDVRDAHDPDEHEPLYPGTVYLLISLMNPDAPEVHGYLLERERVTEIPLDIAD
jgi:[CysO sulfur-carrier protein]-S-L-cysteine hydrolase